MELDHIRNFCIIAHIDHGKTTLSDRLLAMTGTVSEREMEAQLLDSMDLERERGITIKSHPVTMHYKAKNGEMYELNLIDTPGHVDFTYEVSRSLSACEGAILIVDAAQGVEAQTVANYYLAVKKNLVIIPVINKIDLPHADINMAKRQIEDILVLSSDDAILASAKEGIGIEEILEAVIHRIPPPKPTGAPSLQALGYDSYFDTYKGVVTHVRVYNGILKPGMNARLLHSGKTVEIKEVGSFNPKPYQRRELKTGETGYFTRLAETLERTGVMLSESEEDEVNADVSEELGNAIADWKYTLSLMTLTGMPIERIVAISPAPASIDRDVHNPRNNAINASPISQLTILTNPRIRFASISP